LNACKRSANFPQFVLAKTRRERFTARLRAQTRLKYATHLLAVQADGPHRHHALLLVAAVVAAVAAHALVRPAPHVVSKTRTVLLQALAPAAAATFFDALFAAFVAPTTITAHEACARIDERWPALPFLELRHGCVLLVNNHHLPPLTSLAFAQTRAN
jgi:hypothetical protein